MRAHIGIGLAAVGLAAWAQEPSQRIREDVFEVAVPAPGGDEKGDVLIQRKMHGSGPQMATFDFVGAEMSFSGKAVKGAPFSAEAVNESTQVLADGNRIVHRSSSGIFRDGQGRMRREQTLPAIGPWASSGETPQIVTINDPVDNVTYLLESRTKTARKLPGGEGMPGAVAFGIATAPIAAARMAGTARGEGVEVAYEHTIARAGTRVKGPGENAKSESLGKKNIEGIVAEGTRTTHTIAAGEIGNERPIEIVSERWFSDELQTVVMTRHSDPRMGETSYKLTRIDRGEPAQSLFEVPADYRTVDDSIHMKIRRSMEQRKKQRQ